MLIFSFVLHVQVCKCFCVCMFMCVVRVSGRRESRYLYRKRHLVLAHMCEVCWMVCAVCAVRLLCACCCNSCKTWQTCWSSGSWCRGRYDVINVVVVRKPHLCVSLRACNVCVWMCVFAAKQSTRRHSAVLNPKP